MWRVRFRGYGVFWVGKVGVVVDGELLGEGCVYIFCLVQGLQRCDI